MTARRRSDPCEDCGAGPGEPCIVKAIPTVAPPVTASAHPAPSTMAREAETPYVNLPAEERAYRDGVAAGVAAERARVAAWLRAEALRSSRNNVAISMLADDLEGKVQP